MWDGMNSLNGQQYRIDAKKILFALPPEGWSRLLGRPGITQLKTVMTRNPTTSFWLMHWIWLRTAHSGGCWQRLALHTLVMEVTSDDDDNDDDNDDDDK